MSPQSSEQQVLAAEDEKGELETKLDELVENQATNNNMFDLEIDKLKKHFASELFLHIEEKLHAFSAALLQKMVLPNFNKPNAENQPDKCELIITKPNQINDMTHVSSFLQKTQKSPADEDSTSTFDNNVDRSTAKILYDSLRNSSATDSLKEICEQLQLQAELSQKHQSENQQLKENCKHLTENAREEKEKFEITASENVKTIERLTLQLSEEQEKNNDGKIKALRDMNENLLKQNESLRSSNDKIIQGNQKLQQQFHSIQNLLKIAQERENQLKKEIGMEVIAKANLSGLSERFNSMSEELEKTKKELEAQKKEFEKYKSPNKNIPDARLAELEDTNPFKKMTVEKNKRTNESNFWKKELQEEIHKKDEEILQLREHNELLRRIRQM